MQPDSELAACRRILSANHADVRTLLRLGDLHLQRGELDKTLSAYERVAEIYASERKLIKAIAVYKQMHWLIERHAPHLAPRYHYTEARLAEIFEHLGLADDATALLRRIAKRQLDAGQEAHAKASLVRIVGQAPYDVTARMMLATLHAREGDVDTAVRTLEQVVTIALSAQRRGEALTALKRLLALRDNPDHARLAAELLLENHDRADAIGALTYLSTSYRHNPRSLPTLRLLVRAFDRVDKPTKANAVLKESARIVWADGARDTFDRIVDALMTRAGEDEEVRELDRLRREI